MLKQILYVWNIFVLKKYFYAIIPNKHPQHYERRKPDLRVHSIGH